ncbi:MAG: hypothetical protein KUG75_04000 [Pseudomonadales bacterium]|nr:hypothetical protein [Pseudomonadales bacterium]
MGKKTILSYLKSHTETDTELFASQVKKTYARALVIAAYDEPTDFIQPLLPEDAQNLLVILIINVPDNIELGTPELERTQNLLTTFSPAHALDQSACGGANAHEQISACGQTKSRGKLKNYTPPSEGSGAWVINFDQNRNIDILVVDLVHTSRRVHHRKGLGAIRKLGADICLTLIHKKRVVSPWIFCTDADVQLPAGYFQVPEYNAAQFESCSAIILPYKHYVESNAQETPESRKAATSCDLDDASSLYELHMRYYVNRLTWSGSPYAYPTLGSLLIISSLHYAQVRGFPRRPAAEDFYLLNKLAKTGLILTTNGPVVRVQARCSDRVPFGTGPALSKIIATQSRQTYSPASFELLKLFYLELGKINTLPKNIHQCWSPEFSANPRSNRLLEILQYIGFMSFLEKQLSTTKSTIRLQRAIHEWFDAFRTIKFLHQARDLGFEDIPILDAIQEIQLLGEEPSAALSKEPSAALSEEPSAALNKEPSAALNKQSSDAFERTSSKILNEYLAFLIELEQSGAGYNGLGSVAMKISSKPVPLTPFNNIGTKKL